MIRKPALAVIIVLLTAAAPAHAITINLVTNGDFTDGYNGLATSGFNGWTLGGTGNDLVNVTSVAIPSILPGNAAGFGSTNGNDNTITQTLSTVAGTNYSLAFNLTNMDSGGGPSDFSALLNGAPVFAITNAVAFPPTLVTENFIASGASTTLTFAGANAPSFYYLQNVSFGTPDSVAATPLPAALPLFGTALAGLGSAGWMKRRRKLA